MCFFLLWGWQTVVLYLLCSIHSACAAPEYASVQTTVLAFYRNDFLHNLMPLADVFRWIRNFLLVLLLGTATAEVPLRQRKGKFAMESVFAVVFAVIGFIYSDRNTVIPEAAIVIVSLVLGAILLLAARRTVKMHEEI